MNKKFYSISLGQLITMWFFGIIGTFISFGMALDGENSFFIILVIGIPFFLVFYTIGWKGNRKYLK